MKYIISLFLLISILFSQETGIYDVLEKQVKAFNNKDISVMTENLTNDFKWYTITDDSLVTEVSGKDNFKTNMIDYFKFYPEVKSEIEDYVIHKNRISFRESVKYKNKNGQTLISKALAIYEVRNNKIFRAWYFID